MAAADQADTAPHLNATRARSGRRGLHILWVLAISLALAVIVVFGVWAMRSHQLAVANDARQTTPAEAAQLSTTPAPVKQN